MTHTKKKPKEKEGKKCQRGNFSVRRVVRVQREFKRKFSRNNEYIRHLKDTAESYMLSTNKSKPQETMFIQKNFLSTYSHENC